MALQTSGAISMSQIKDEFGGAGSHSLSEYYPLAGLGVSGIPSSGAISFSSFHGKSKNVTTSVWTSSGYNQSTNVFVAEHWNGGWWTGAVGARNTPWSGWRYFGSFGSFAAASSWGGYTWVRTGQGKYTWSNNNAWNTFRLLQYQTVTSWVDTSAYVNTATIASIST
jgi:hypothetical protein